MNSTPIDSEIFKDQFGTKQMRTNFSDENLIQLWLNSEVALAKAEAKLGIIPQNAATNIANAADQNKLDFNKIREGMKKTGHPFVAFLHEFESLCDEESRKYIHWGATTQDIIDTGLTLQIKGAHELIYNQTQEILKICLRLSQQYKSTVMPGRTLGQHALPITFGYKISIWSDELGRHLERLQQGADRYLVGQLGGAVGTLASLGAQGLAVRKEYVKNLNLIEPLVSWHTARDRFAEFSMILNMIGATTAKVAEEIISLQGTEIREVEEGYHSGKVGSSTMPHKRNPMTCSYIVGLTKIVNRKSTLAIDSMIQKHERDVTFWQSEWSYISEICITLSGALEQLKNVLTNLIVNEEQMKKNLFLTKGLIVSENVMLELGKIIGRTTAHDLLYELTMRAFEEDKDLKDILLEDNEIKKYFSDEEINSLTNPESYTGLSEKFVDDVYNKWLSYT